MGVDLAIRRFSEQLQDLVPRKFLFDSWSSRHYLRWNSHDCRARGDIGDYNRIRADDYVIANGYTSQYPAPIPIVTLFPILGVSIELLP